MLENIIKTIMCSVRFNGMHIYSRKCIDKMPPWTTINSKNALCTERKEMSSLINHSIPPVGMASGLRITTPFSFFTILYIVRAGHNAYRGGDPRLGESSGISFPHKARECLLSTNFTTS